MVHPRKRTPRLQAALGVDLQAANVAEPEPSERPRRMVDRLAYEGASNSRAIGKWRTARSEADSEWASGAVTLAQRSRDTVRNVGLARRALWQISMHLVGTGIRPLRADHRALALWAQWARRPTTESRLTVYGLQLQAALSMLESGETLIRRRYRRPADGLPVPMQVQHLESDFLDETLTRQLAAGQIVQGVEFDSIGQLSAYHLRRQHPGAYFGGVSGVRTDVVRVPESEVAHLYVEALSRPGQTRGIPWLTPTLLRLRQMSDYRNSEAMRKRNASSLSVLVTGAPAVIPESGGDPEPLTGATVVDADGHEVETWYPGTVAYTPEGEAVTFPQPPADQSYPLYMAWELHEVAAEVGVPYELLTGDLSGTNYSSIRYGLIAFKRLIDVIRETVIVPLLCDRLWSWFIDAAILGGQLPAAEYPCEWSTPAWPDVDEEKAAIGAQKLIRAGLSTLRAEITARGHDADTVLDELEAERRDLEARDLATDSDPNQTTNGGQFQVAPGSSTASHPPAEPTE